ncbi:aldehyde ferredoxin oxidoreductase family protein [Proteiniclasticum sp. QWL-01]|uniref:aldehyde ferredoxin oxidoreductase family protein n=1 Tax=Proteiniclasticum sp. QWL-01 TaxID=3036945 RepID=UPI00240F8F2D|nr:aldehyde ferredoxin oxidoreductase family protein [Proteiniclasticum sp. QWL-01]WFF71479.1 aldehyde ferredoxin oxidoreductase family protein [Proteiniclasticum sp. QWL-01]
MDKLYGYAGKMLFVDLGSGAMEERQLTREMAETFLGGYGIGARILYDMMPQGTHPFSEESVIGFTVGPCTGTGAVMSGRWTAVHKSPVTMGWNDSNCGGFFGPELKKAGYDAVFIRGLSSRPVYLWIHDGQAEIRDAGHLWGKSIKETEIALRVELNEPRMQSAAIGPAGEHLSFMATIMNDRHRAAGRAGAGSVMGSKQLKAVVVRGSAHYEPAQPEEFKALNKKMAQHLANPPETKDGQVLRKFKQYGTTGGNTPNILSGEAPVKNWGGSGIDDFGEENAEKLGGPYFDGNYNIRPYGCANCAIRCGAQYQVQDGKYFSGSTDRPEYETLAAFGENCLLNDIDAIIKLNEMSNEGGMDTISAGSTLAWAMECMEHGVLTPEDLDGINLTWGNGDAMIELLDRMIQGKGAGEKLMNGQRAAIQAFGRGAEFETTAGGVEPGMHDSRRSKGYNRIYQFDPTPGRHMKGGDPWSPLDTPNRPSRDVEMMTAVEVLNSAGFCAFSSRGFKKDTINQFISYTTGRRFDLEEQLRTGKRIFFMRHLFNLREGITKKDLTLSPRLNGPLDKGPLAGVVIPSDQMGDDFFRELGWDPDTLIPPREWLEELGGFEFAYDFLYGNTK